MRKNKRINSNNGANYKWTYIDLFLFLLNGIINKNTDDKDKIRYGYCN